MGAHTTADDLAARMRADLDALPEEGPEALFAHVHAEHHPELARQQRDLQLHLDGLDAGEEQV